MTGLELSIVQELPSGKGLDVYSTHGRAKGAVKVPFDGKDVIVYVPPAEEPSRKV